MDLDALDELFAILTRQRFSVNALNCPACGVTVPATNPGANGAGPDAQPSTSKNDDGVASGVPATDSPSGVIPGALHGVKSAGRDRRPAHRGVIDRRAGAAVQVDLQFAERRLRVFQELRRQLPRRGVRLALTRGP